MFEILKPKAYLESLTNIDLKKLKNKMKIKGIVIDLDNTTVAWGEDDVDVNIKKWINEAKEINISICLVSNTLSGRVKKFAEIFNIPYLSNSFKPFNLSFKKATKILKTEYSETIVIGDQIFTDILGGNRLNIYTVLVAPLGKRDSIGTFIQRSLEKLILAYWLKTHEVKIEKGNWPK
ncbi:MAG: YqeG family HAD IIIA-type phosphatase [Candidatus Caldatribacteriota bacterium]|nr:YqeG family HAD IIIA-type phosphatase [Candidatus Caldatribacteriota bacterium]